MRDCFQTLIGHVWTSTLMKLYPSTISLSLFYNFFAFFSMAFLVKEGSLLWKVWLLSTSSVVAGSDATEPIQDWNTISSFYKGQPQFSSAH